MCVKVGSFCNSLLYDKLRWDLVITMYMPENYIEALLKRKFNFLVTSFFVKYENANRIESTGLCLINKSSRNHGKRKMTFLE